MTAYLFTSRTAQMMFLSALLLAAAGGMFLQPAFVERIQQYTFDTYNRILPRKNAGDVVIVGMDQETTKYMGQWPPGRDLLGDVVTSLRGMGAKSIVFDFTFMFDDRTAGQGGKGAPEAAKPGTGKESTYNDIYFADKIAKAGNVVFPILAVPQDRERETMLKAPIAWRGGTAAEIARHMPSSPYFVGSLPIIMDAAAGAGHANYITEKDGILRRFSLMMGRVDGGGNLVTPVPSMSMEAVRVSLGAGASYEVAGSARGGVESVRVGPYTVPTDEFGSARVYYAGRAGRTYVPLWKVIGGQADPAQLRGKIVFIGAMSENMGDIKPSPIDSMMRGVEAHAEMTEQILAGQFLRRTDAMGYAEIAATLAASLAVIFLAQETNALLLGAVVAAFAAAFGGAGFAAFRYAGWLVDPVCPAAVTTVIFMLASILAALRTTIVSNEKSKFLALMSHEIRTPMTGILGIIEFLKDEGLTKEERADFINTISECSKTLLNTLNDILDVSKLEEGKLEISNINCDLQGVLGNCVNILDRMARNKGIELKAEVEDGVPRQIYGDPHRLQQIILNFMNNAIKFTPKGSVTVRASFKPGPPPFIRVEVRDTGIGISEKNMKKLFSSFSQADDSIARKFGGTGLGLSIAKDLLMLMGGKVGVNSKLGEGSTFWFEIPFLEPVAADASAEEENTDIGPMDVLLAEDNKVNQQVAMRLLNNKGHKVSIADDGETVVRMVQEGAFDMILMDMNMPVKSGIDAAKEIRALGGKYKTMPIIALTANVVDEYVKKCYDAGMNAHVAKPFSPKELYQVMAKFAPAHALAAAPAPAVAAASEPAGEKLNDNLQEIRKQLGAEYLNELIRNSLKEANRLLKAARDAWGAEDVAGLQHATHDLKNVSGLISLDETNHLAELIETLCRKNELTALPDMMKALVRDGEREIRKMERARGLAS